MKTTGEINMQEIITAAYASLIADDYAHDAYGFRMLPHGADQYAVGDAIVIPSKVWDDGEITDRELNGVSATMIDFAADDSVKSVEKAAKWFAYNNYLGRKVALIAGDVGDNGKDLGEIVISNPVVLAVWDV